MDGEIHIADFDTQEEIRLRGFEYGQEAVEKEILNVTVYPREFEELIIGDLRMQLKWATDFLKHFGEITPSAPTEYNLHMHGKYVAIKIRLDQYLIYYDSLVERKNKKPKPRTELKDLILGQHADKIVNAIVQFLKNEKADRKHRLQSAFSYLCKNGFMAGNVPDQKFHTLAQKAAGLNPSNSTCTNAHSRPPLEKEFISILSGIIP